MKKKILIIPIALMFLFAGCTPSSGNGNNKGTSVEPSPSEQSVPNYDGIPDYGSYSGIPVGENHFQGFSIAPSNVTYGKVGESFTVKTTSIKPNLSIPAEELIFTYETSVDDLITVTPSTDTREATIECLVPGDVTLTVYSFQKRFNRKLKIRVLPNDGTIDFYLPEVASNGSLKDSEKAKFGWVSGDAPGGTASGDAVLGAYTWHYERSNVGSTITGGSGTFKFGAADQGTTIKHEGKMTFSTTFSRAVKEVVIQCSSASAEDPETGYALDYGSSTFNAWFDEDDYLERTVDGVTYASGVECHTSKYASDEPVKYHIINCSNKTGLFTFELGPSRGAIYLKSILIEYAE